MSRCLAIAPTGASGSDKPKERRGSTEASHPGTSWEASSEMTEAERSQESSWRGSPNARVEGDRGDPWRDGRTGAEAIPADVDRDRSARRSKEVRSGYKARDDLPLGRSSGPPPRDVLDRRLVAPWGVGWLAR
jgi:hypothetical protein